jgi:hypothetical protein
MMMTCSICEIEKPVADYYQSNGKPQKRCKECQKAYARQWNAQHYEKIIKVRERFGIKYRTKTRKENHDETKKQRKAC